MDFFLFFLRNFTDAFPDPSLVSVGQNHGSFAYSKHSLLSVIIIAGNTEIPLNQAWSSDSACGVQSRAEKSLD